MKGGLQTSAPIGEAGSRLDGTARAGQGSPLDGDLLGRRIVDLGSRMGAGMVNRINPGLGDQAVNLRRQRGVLIGEVEFALNQQSGRALTLERDLSDTMLRFWTRRT